METEKQAHCVAYSTLGVALGTSHTTLPGWEPSLLTDLDLDRASRRAHHNSRATYTSSTLGVLAAHKMAAAGPSVLDLAGCGDFDSLAQALMSLLLRHLANSFG